MVKIKIVSNPYDKNITYYRWDEAQNEWQIINYENNGNSLLISDDLTTNFFPFKANKIVDVIIDEFSDGHVSIEFEGTDDEYEIIREICVCDDYKDVVTITRSATTLENARDILPEIVRIYNEIRPIVDRSIKNEEVVEDEFNKFTDATNDQVPICVVGNYSAGKSSFINALIGAEILPSGDEPLTARIFKISPSHDDRGYIRFKYEGKNFAVIFNGNEQHVESEIDSHPLIDKIKEVIEPLNSVDMVRSINRTLRTINNFEEEEFDENISDLIEIQIPFNSTMFGHKNIDYVIFDTPGSNTATNYKHVEVLRKAMENMSNGLPIFVAEFNSLDSIDNEKLYKDIDSMEELDSRFTMVIVNKSDKANLPIGGFSPEDEDKILNMSIPRNLYSGGIYFVSSVIGLGSKTNGEFDDEFYEEVFDDVSPRFENPEHKRYKNLYKYNIMPTQLKKNIIAESEAYDNLLLANSGLFCVEQEINRFAEVYSAYNKCIQAELFLGKILDATFEDISEAKSLRVKSRITRNHMLEQDKAKTIDDIETKEEEIKERYATEYLSFLQGVLESQKRAYTVEQFKEEENLLKSKHEEDIDISAFEKAYKASSDKFVGSFAHFSQIGTAFKEWRTGASRLSNAERAVQIRAANELFSILREKMQLNDEEIHSTLIAESDRYWKEQSELIRKEIISIVTNSSGLSEEKEKELEQFIVSYQPINLHKPDIANMDKENYESRLMAIIISDPLNLNRGKLIKAYNSEISMMEDAHLASIYGSYISCFREWFHSLVVSLLDNIIDINPELAAQNEIINQESKEIEELDNTRIKLEQYVEQIRKMINWNTP